MEIGKLQKVNTSRRSNVQKTDQIRRFREESRKNEKDS